VDVPIYRVNGYHMNSQTLLNKSYWQPIQHRWRQCQFTRQNQRAFLEDFAALIEDGVPASQAIDVIISVSIGITQAVAKSISASIARGQTLADGMQPWFSHAIVEIIRVGESNGALPQALRSATNMYTSYGATFSAFLTSVLYPLTVLVMALGMTVFIKNSVLHSFLDAKPLAAWPSVGKTLYRMGETIQLGWWLILLTVISLGVIVNNVLKNVTGEVRRWIDNIPLISLYRAMLAARFMETLGLLLSNGVVIKQALSTMQYDASPYLSWHLLQMEYHLSGGQENIADVLDTQLLSRHDLMRLRVIAKGKGFDEALISLGRQARQRTAKKIDIAGKVIGALLLLSGAVIAMTIVFGIYTVGSSFAF
jgi:type II secretory pathway component PulF